MQGRGNQPPPAPKAPDKYLWPAKPALIGTAVKRFDGPDKVAGRAKYSYDISRPGMIYGKILRSPHAHARIVSIDLSAAEKAPGVKAALAWKQPGTKVMFQGDEVAALAADTEEHAGDAIRLIKVEYEELPHLATVEQAMAPDAPAVFEGGNTKVGPTQENGDIDAGFKQAVHTIEATYATHTITHVCLETHGCVAEWDGDKLTAWVSTQAVHGTAQQLAQALQIPQPNVRVHGRRLRQQVRAGQPGRHLREARAAGEASGEADARSQGRASRHRQPSVRHRAHQSRRHGRWPADLVRRAELGLRRRRRDVEFSAALHLRLPESPAHAQGRVHQRRPAASDAGAWPSAGVLPH
jgi:xanthine dehydrogenase molybdopterin-binding subunit B